MLDLGRRRLESDQIACLLANCYFCIERLPLFWYLAQVSVTAQVASQLERLAVELECAAHPALDDLTAKVHPLITALAASRMRIAC